MLAAATGNCDVVKELISLGADVDVQTNLVSHFLCFINGSDPQTFTRAQNSFVNCLYSCHIYFTYGILSLWDIQLTLTDKVSGLGKHIVNPWCACAARVAVLGLSVCVCLSVCLSVYLYSRTTGNEAARERYTHLQRNKRSKNNVADLAKTAAFWQEKPARRGPHFVTQPIN